MGGSGDDGKQNPCREITDDRNRELGQRRYRNKEGYEMRWDPEWTNPDTGEVFKEHWHVTNPNKTGWRDMYLDKFGKPAAYRSRESHLYGDDIAGLMEILGGTTC